ncbi:Hypothetical protein FKW44_001604 [Caligus rogercresseyi]|uniref:Uncharacterized protein n=1 Tax=Caligus rogercresseyi TaxID=217165 RepID=A0A7T8KJB0_CALRO|nr:Hypothetical protein FKW44_001604 [Caligus rogercresseyi]
MAQGKRASLLGSSDLALQLPNLTLVTITCREVGGEACATHHNSVEALRSRPSRLCHVLGGCGGVQSVRAFKSRVETVEAGGGHIEKS